MDEVKAVQELAYWCIASMKNGEMREEEVVDKVKEFYRLHQTDDELDAQADVKDRQGAIETGVTGKWIKDEKAEA